MEVAATLYLTFSGMYVSTNMCNAVNLNTSSTVAITSCVPNTNKNILIVTLNNTVRLPALNNYTLTINGISIDSSAIANYVYFEVRDPTGSYTIESATKILITMVAQDFPIYLNQINYAKNNPVVQSNLFINFTLPRPLNSD